MLIISYRSKNMHTVEWQQCINKINTSTREDGFKFSKKTKSKFTSASSGKCMMALALKIDGTKIPVVQHKFLGVIFYSRLTFIPHIKALRIKCNKANQLLRVVTHTDWGADKITLLNLYWMLIHSELDFGCFICGSTRKS